MPPVRVVNDDAAAEAQKRVDVGVGFGVYRHERLGRPAAGDGELGWPSRVLAGW